MKRPVPTPEAIQALARAAAGMSGVERRKMFGFPALFVGGAMFAGVKGDGLVVRLAEPDRARLIAAGEAAPSVAMGRIMKEWVNLTPATVGSAALAALLDLARAYTASLPAKPKKRRAN